MIFSPPKKIGLVILLFATGFFVFPARAVGASEVIINEIAWMGTTVDYNDEWIELYNNTETAIDINGWILQAQDGTPKIFLAGIVPAGGFFILERTDDQTLPTITADQIYTGALGNVGENLELRDSSGNLIDSVNCASGWFAGDNTTKQTMERKNSQLSGSDKDNWGTSQNVGGTPKAQNSVFQIEPTPIPTPTPTATPSPTPTSTPTPASTLTPALTPSPTFTPTPSLTPTSTPKPVYSRSVVINEFIPNPVGDDAEGEWIELFNEGSEPVDLSGWKLADKASKFTIPKNTTIGAKSFLVFPYSVTKISINNNDGEILSLFDPSGDLAFRVSYEGKAPEGQSLARHTDGQWFWTTLPTPGSQNIIRAVTSHNSKTASATPASVSLVVPPLSVNSLNPTPLPAREETIGVPTRASNLVSSSESPSQGNLNQEGAEENHFLNKNQTAVAGTGWLNYKITGLAVLLGLFSVAGILILKRFLI